MKIKVSYTLDLDEHTLFLLVELAEELERKRTFFDEHKHNRDQDYFNIMLDGHVQVIERLEQKLLQKGITKQNRPHILKQLRKNGQMMTRDEIKEFLNS